MREQLDEAIALVEEVLGDASSVCISSAQLPRRADADQPTSTSSPSRGGRRRRTRGDASSSGCSSLDAAALPRADDRRRGGDPAMAVSASDGLPDGDSAPSRARARGDRAAAPNPDLAALITMTRDKGKALSDLGGRGVRRRSEDDLARRGLDGIDHALADLDDDTRNMLLMLRSHRSTAETGVIRSKDAAADASVPHLPPASTGPCVERARDGSPQRRRTAAGTTSTSAPARTTSSPR